MNTDSSSAVGSNILLLVLGLLAVSLIVLVATGRNLSVAFISTDRAALIAIFVIGFAMCAVGGIGKVVTTYGWTSPVSIIGSVLGVLITLVVLAVLFGIRLPIITTERAAFIFVAAIIATKVIINLAAWLLRGTNTLT